MGSILADWCLGEKAECLGADAREFLAVYGTGTLMGGMWASHFRDIAPGKRFDRLLALTGYDGDVQGFFTALEGQIRSAATQGQSAEVVLNGIKLPEMFLYHLLEARDPGQSLLTVKNTEKLEGAAGVPVLDRETMQAVLDQYPVRLSKHVIRQSLVSGPVAAQYLPFTDELDPQGHTMTFEGHFKQGLVEQMYQNRAIFLLDMRCPVYCRFCFRKHKSLRREKSPSPNDVARAVARVREDENIKEILITGGEPLINMQNMDAALTGLMEIPHVRTMRLATRSLAYFPHLFLHHGGALISWLKAWQKTALDKGKSLEIGVHMVHPDEVSVQSLEIISELTASGVPVYVQTPFLKGLNDTGEVLGRLFTLLRHAGAEIYYIFTPCHPIHGTRKYWSPISLSIEAYAHLRENFSDRAIPKLCTATPLGKMEWHTSGWAVEPDKTDCDHIWIRTPYTREYFRKMIENGGQFPAIRENLDGTLDVKCLIDMGDHRLFLGAHNILETSARERAVHNDAALQKILACCYQAPELTSMGAPGPCPGVRRVHRTRVETDLSSKKVCQAYLSDHPGITDIVLRVPGKDIQGDLDRISGFIRELDRFGERPFCIRIRWQAFGDCPDGFTQEHIDRIADFSSFSFTLSRRVEIESWWLVPEQVTPAHKRLARTLLSRGIPVYGNMALLAGINDEPSLTVKMAHALREGRIDFHHVFVSGLSVQSDFPEVGDDRVLAVASHVRMVCSGREIPLYVHRRSGGEESFGLFPGFSFQAASSS